MRPTRRDSTLVAVGAAVSGLSGFGFTWLLARATGPAGAGVVLTVTTWFTLCLTVAKFGMDTTLVREGGRIRAGGPGVGHRRVLSWTLRPVLVATTVAGVAIAAAAGPIGDWILTDSPVPLTPLVAVAGLTLPLGVYTVVQLAFLRGLGSMNSYVLIEQILKPGLRVAGALGLLAVGVTGALAFGWVWFFPVVLGAALTFAVTRATSRDWSHDPGPPGERRRVWDYSVPRGASQAVDIVNSSVGTVALGILSTPAQTGAFATALRVVFAGQLAFQAVRLLVAPSFAALLTQHRAREAQEVFASSSSLIVVLAWPAFLVCLVFPHAVLSLFGSGFEAATASLQILSVSGLLLAVVGNQGSIVLMSGRSAAALRAVSCGMVANVAITLGLLGVWGAEAAALGWTVAVAVEGAVLALVLRQEGFRPVPGQALRMALRITLTIGVGLVLGRILQAHDQTVAALTLIVAGFAAAVVWAGRPAVAEFHLLTRGEARV